MKVVLLLAVIMAFGLLQAHGNLLDFHKMIKKATGKEAASSYGFYGCYCGWKGRGTPKDATDRCCAAHDCCYHKLEKQGCKTKSLKYKADYRGNQIICEKQGSSCSVQVCECDRVAALCFARNLSTYNKKYQFYNNLLCKGKGPQC
ncbi:phospholipase A2, membrane associated-like [Erinaceus europaeus]|uniref:Phospholipase A2 n=1 Tax=Erinaceus europaeus TaxID=9365 RepID=A0A1S3AH08_ERIEU|nr:phospholipase A2, membrane associated-like [Erinaceus europaeus]